MKLEHLSNLRFTKADNSTWAADLPNGTVISGDASLRNRIWRELSAKGFVPAAYVAPPEVETVAEEVETDPVEKLRAFLHENPDVKAVLDGKGG